jgi:N-acetylglucosaminyldiphosphoundecaprenol N-acetyl-beta-D-mannosaminyltransferase
MLERKEVFGFNFISSKSVADIARACIEYKYQQDSGEGLLPLMITPNAAQIVKYHHEYAYLKVMLEKAVFILPDGQPIVWTSRLINRPLLSRLTGSDLFPVLWNLIKKSGKKAYFILPNQETAFCLHQEYDKIKTYVPPFIGLQDRALINQIVEIARVDILEFKPDFVFIGLSFPKQEILSLEIYQQCGNITLMPLFLSLGASYEFYCGMKKRAPKFIQWMGMEWFYRFMQEPTRMWRRYTIDNFRFIILMSNQVFKKIKERFKPKCK